MNYYPCSETGYYDNELNFSNHDAEIDARERNREDRFEHEAQEMLERLWEGESDIDQATRRGMITNETAGPRVPLCDAVQLSFGMSTNQILNAMRRPVRRTKRVRKAA